MKIYHFVSQKVANVALNTLTFASLVSGVALEVDCLRKPDEYLKDFNAKEKTEVAAINADKNLDAAEKQYRTNIIDIYHPNKPLVDPRFLSALGCVVVAGLSSTLATKNKYRSLTRA